MRRRNNKLQRTPVQPEIQQYFPGTRAAVSQSRTAEKQGGADFKKQTPKTARGECESLDLAEHIRPAPPERLETEEGVPGNMDIHLLEDTAPRYDDRDLGVLLQALPTGADIEKMIARLEEAHSREIKVVQTEVQRIANKLEMESTTLASLENRIKQLEQVQIVQSCYTPPLQLRVEEMEDRSRRKNLRFRGVPEAIGKAD